MEFFLLEEQSWLRAIQRLIAIKAMRNWAAERRRLLLMEEELVGFSAFSFWSGDSLITIGVTAWLYCDRDT